MAKLTERIIEALTCEPGRKDRLVFDDAVPGLGVRIMASGKKTFLAQYTVAGRKRRVPIGRWGSITLEQARLAARGIFGDVAKGQDVAGVRKIERTRVKADAAADKMTLAVLLEQWASLALAQRRATYRREAVRAIKMAFPQHLGRRADALTRPDAVHALDNLVKAGKPAMAARTMAYGRACYTWAARRGKVPENPFTLIPVPAATASRDRVLTNAEVGYVWRAAGIMAWPFGPLIRLLLLTAQRRDEVASMAWSEMSANQTMWTIPKERAKNGRSHIVHLALPAQEILASLPRFTGSDLVFTTTGKTAVSGFSGAKRTLDNLIQGQRDKAARAAGQPDPPPLPAWRLHDFRRTAVTWLAGNGVAPHVADRLLNHVQGTISGVAAVYQRGEFLAERKAALEAWAAYVTGPAFCGPG